MAPGKLSRIGNKFFFAHKAKLCLRRKGSMRHAFAFLLAGSLVTGSASADWRQLPSKDFPLKAPPAVGSPESEEDYRLIEEAEAARTDADCRLAAKQNEPAYPLFFYDEASPLPRAEAKRAEALVSPVMHLAARIAGYHKAKYRRPRPYDVRDSIHPCVERPGGAKSYPSSHAAAASAATCVLSAAFPEKAAALRAYGNRLGELRVVVGVHHPSDVAAGASLGEALCERLLKDESFQGELEEMLTLPR